MVSPHGGLVCVGVVIDGEETVDEGEMVEVGGSCDDAG